MVKGKFETAIPWAWIASGGVIEFSNLISVKMDSSNTTQEWPLVRADTGDGR